MPMYKVTRVDKPDEEFVFKVEEERPRFKLSWCLTCASVGLLCLALIRLYSQTTSIASLSENGLSLQGALRVIADNEILFYASISSMFAIAGSYLKN